MGENSKIEWTDHTFSPWWGCERISPACDHCYAATWAKRTGFPDLWSGERRFFGDKHWNEPLRLNRAAAKAGTRARVFCASMADVFDNHREVGPHRERLWALIRETPNLDWLILTKRIGNAISMLPDDWYEGYPNVWLGATVVNQTEADRDVPKLLATPARVHFLSVEPQLGPISLADDSANFIAGKRRVHWVICGGESGPKARELPCHWARDLRKQCEANSTAFFMKQGSQANWPDFKNIDSFPADLRVRQWPGSAAT